MQFGNGADESSLFNRSNSQIGPGYREQRKLRQNRDRSVWDRLRRSALVRLVDNLDFLGLVAVGVASVMTRAAQMAPAGVTPVVVPVPGRVRLHVSRQARAESADQGETHLN